MNRIHRIVFNRALGVCQAVAEVASSSHGSAGSAAGTTATRLPSRSLLASACILALAGMATGNVWADGGAGGNGYRPATGNSQGHTGSGGAAGIAGVDSATGVGGAGGAGVVRASGTNYNVGGGGGGGATITTGVTAGQGGAGGKGGVVATGANGGTGGTVGRRIAEADGDITISTVSGGGSNGTGGTATAVAQNFVDGGAGGGGGGGAALVSLTTGTLTVTAAQTGGGGGTGGVAGGNSDGTGTGYGGGGGGGQGGMGLMSTSGGNVTVSTTGTLRGGAGGAGGAASYGSGGNGGQGGAGAVLAGNRTLTNRGTIAGGNGGALGTHTRTAVAGTNGTAGLGGVGIEASGGVTIVNSGTIEGGQSGVATNKVRANAIEFSGGGNTLSLEAGSVITGNAVGSTGPVGDKLQLGGSADATFAVGSIGAAAQYRNFTSFQKTGIGTWTLTGTNTGVTPWTVSEGRLSIAADGALGDVSGGLTLDGGALLTTAAKFTSARDVVLGAGGILEVAAGNTQTWSGVFSGEGVLVKTGAGTTTLTNTNTYTGPTGIFEGTLALSGNGTIADSSGLVIADKGMFDISGVNGAGASVATLDGAGYVALGDKTLTITAGTDTTYAGAIGGEGGVTLAGGTQTLAGANTYTGDTTVAGGTLRVNGSLASGAVNVASGAALGGGGSIAGPVSIAAGGTLLGIGGQTLTTGALAVDKGAVINAVLGTAGNSSLFQVNGALTLGGTVDVAASEGFGAGVYKLVSYTGVFTNNGFAIGAVPEGTDLYLQTSVANQVNLINTTGQTLNFWDGDAVGSRNSNTIEGGDGTWTAITDNWTTASGFINAPMKPQPGFAIFQAAPGTVNVSNADGAVSVTGIQFASDGYVLQGDPIALAGSEAVVRVGDGSSAVYTATIASALTGAAQLQKTDVGTLVLTGANTYSGGTAIAGGTLQLGNGGTTGSILGDVANNGTLAFNRSDAVTFAGAISGSGAVQQLGSGTTTLAGANSYTGGTVIAAGTLVGNAASFGSGAIVNDGALVLEQATDATMANTLSGSGSLTKTGAATVFYTGNGAGFTGALDVTGGTLSVTGSLAATVTVEPGTTLKGNGSVGNTFVANGATVAPGNSIGTLTVNGNLTFAPGAVYQVETNPQGQSDLINVTGTATLGGASVVVIAADGTWAPTTRYTILTSGNRVGTFGGVSSNFAFLDPSLTYEANNVLLTLNRNTVAFPAVGVTPNQRASAAALEALGPVAGGSLYNAVVQLDTPTARSAFDQLSGELHASVRSSMIEDSRFVREAGIDRVRQAQGGATDLTTVEGIDGGAWGRVYGSWGKTDSDRNAAQVHRDASGVLVGADRRVGTWRVGVMGGAGRSDVDVDERASSAKIDNYHLGVYGGTEWGALALRTGASYTHHEIDTQRSIAFTGLAGSPSASYDARTAQLFGELGWRLDTGGAVALEPFANLAYVNLKTDRFSEVNNIGGVTALSGRSGSTDTTFTTLGLRASTKLDLGAATGTTLRGLVGWRHAFGDVSQEANLAFNGGGSFTVGGVPIASDAAVIEAGLDFAIRKDLTVGVSYSGQVGDRVKDHGVRANLLWKF